jgi:hypothetical protein
MVEIKKYERWELPADRKRLEEIQNKQFSENYLDRLNKEIESIAETRFTKLGCSHSFAKLKRLTKYH